MSVFLISGVLFFIGYLINIFYITVLYHRGLTHKAVKLSPFAIKWTAKTGIWMTGIDPKSWVCMHRLHHDHSDTERDPHSPMHRGLFGVALAQLKYYEKTLVALIKKKPVYSDIVKDLNFPVSSLNKKGLWYLPYVLHVMIAVIFAVIFKSWVPGMAYFLGIMSHPVQGWLVNSLAHRFGYRNFQTKDNSRNNTLVAWFVAGEGYQNNHHAQPQSAKFSNKWYEFDAGYLMCKVAAGFGFLKFPSI